MKTGLIALGAASAMKVNAGSVTGEVTEMKVTERDNCTAHPGRVSNHSLDAEFPVAALKAKNLKEVRRLPAASG